MIIIIKRTAAANVEVLSNSKLYGGLKEALRSWSWNLLALRVNGSYFLSLSKAGHCSVDMTAFSLGPPAQCTHAATQFLAPSCIRPLRGKRKKKKPGGPATRNPLPLRQADTHTHTANSHYQRLTCFISRLSMKMRVLKFPFYDARR